MTSRVVASLRGNMGEDWDYRDTRDLRAGKSHPAGTVHWFGMERRGQDLPLPKHPWPSVGTGITFLGKNLRMGIHWNRVG